MVILVIRVILTLKKYCVHATLPAHTRLPLHLKILQKYPLMIVELVSYEPTGFNTKIHKLFIFDAFMMN